MKKHGHFSMKQNYLNNKLRPNAGCGIELPRVSNYPGAISLGVLIVQKQLP